MEVAQISAQNTPYHKHAVLNMLELADFITPEDRPGWIPPDIPDNWDTDHYAYQTEEELMPAGGLHGKILNYVVEILRDLLASQGQMSLSDTFILYRDIQGIKQRSAPDLLLMPFRLSPPSVYDLDDEPPPLAVMEIASPKSHKKDMQTKVDFYADLKIPAYFVIDPITSDGTHRKQIELYLWRKTPERFCKMLPDAEGYLPVPELNVKIKAQGHNLIFKNIVTDEILLDIVQM